MKTAIIYYSKHHGNTKKLLAFAKAQLPNVKDVFFIYTYGAKENGYTVAIRKAITEVCLQKIQGRFKLSCILCTLIYFFPVVNVSEIISITLS